MEKHIASAQMMLWLGLAVVLCASPRPAAAQSLPLDLARISELRYEATRFIGISRSGGSFPGPRGDSVIVLDGSGRQLLTFTPGDALQRAADVSIRDAALSGDRLVISMDLAYSESEHQSTLVLYNIGARAVDRMVNITPVECVEIALDVAGTVWCLGQNVREPRDARRHLLHRLSTDGRLLGSYLPRSSLPGTHPAPYINTSHSLSTLTITGDALFVWLPMVDCYVKMRLSNFSVQVDRVAARIASDSIAADVMFGNERVVAQLRAADGSRRLYQQDQIGARWEPLTDQIGNQRSIRLLGFEGMTPLLWDKSRNIVARPGR